ncbi:unnamed protein product [Lactuca virosa]|uniref:Histone deacetylase n=1 Tax=Lactuca virosa TaxID=75947 RepID=A0AAU9NRU6_9ASTR|nr:unnamed protein product [Lactuca virosa]
MNSGKNGMRYNAKEHVVGWYSTGPKLRENDLDVHGLFNEPPGHHAEETEPMGFCLLNNVAIATSCLLNQKELGINKILIVDWDVHHGNGTQKSFYKDSQVLFFSLHRDEYGTFYPYGDDGSYDMKGEGEAIGDPLRGCRITPHGFAILLKKLMEFSNGKIVMALEGGYNLNSIANSVLSCVQVLLEDKHIFEPYEIYPFESTWRVIKEGREELSAYWPILAEKLPEKLTSKVTPLVKWPIQYTGSELGFSGGSVAYVLLTLSSCFLVVSWLFVPYIFNPSGFEWQKAVEDFDDLTNWLMYKGGVGVKGDNSWESWWDEEQAHIQTIRGRVLETILCLRFFIFQYGIVYKLQLTGNNTSFLDQGLSISLRSQELSEQGFISLKEL